MTPLPTLPPAGSNSSGIFVNTVDLPNGPDELDTVERAAGWCLSHGLAPVADERDLGLLRAFRETLRDLLSANNGEGDAPAAWERLRTLPVEHAARSRGAIPSAGLELRPEDEGADRLAAGDGLRVAAARHVVAPACLPQELVPLRVLRPLQERLARVVQHGDVRKPAKAKRRRERERNAAP